MLIGLDFDGVISDCGQLKSESAKKIYGIDIPPARFKKELIIHDGLLNEQQYRNLQKIIYTTRDTGLAIKPVDGVLLYLPKIIAEGHQIKIVTSRDKEALEIAKEWAKIHGIELEFIGVGYGKSKRAAASGLDVFIDDNLDKLIPLAGVVPHLFLYAWGYNSHINTGAVAQKIFSWKEIYQTIQALSSLTHK